MSDLFDMSLDHLVKGDSEFKQQILDGKINKHEKKDELWETFLRDIGGLSSRLAVSFTVSSPKSLNFSNKIYLST